MCICQSQSLNSSYLPFPPWCLYVYSLCLCLYFCFANKIISTLKEYFFKLGKLWGNGEIWVPSIQGRVWNTDGELGIACYLKPGGKVARKWENRTDRELGKCQCEIPQFPFPPLTPNGYCWPVCCQILTQYRWLITSFKFWPSSGSAQRCRDVSLSRTPNTVLLSFDSLPFHMDPLLPSLQLRMVTSQIALTKLGGESFPKQWVLQLQGRCDAAS